MSQPDVNIVSRNHQMPHESQAVLATAVEAYVALDAGGRVVGWNPAAETTFGYNCQQVYGRDLAALIIPQRFQAAHRAGLVRVAAGEPRRQVGQRLQVTARHADGHEFPLELTLSVTIGPDGPRFHAFSRDITVERRVARFAAVESTVTRALAEATSSATAATRVVEALATGMGWPVAELWLVDEQLQLLTCAARHTEPDRPLSRFCLNELEFGACLAGRVHHAAVSQWIPDLAADGISPRSRAAARAGLHVAVGVPICTGQRTIGTLCVFGDRIEDPKTASPPAQWSSRPDRAVPGTPPGRRTRSRTRPHQGRVHRHGHPRTAQSPRSDHLHRCAGR